MQPPSDLHGLGHTARVMVWAAVLARDTEWFEPVVWAAACHDLRRHDDGADYQHGHRAARWMRLHLPQKLIALPWGLDLAAEACAWHVCSDSAAEWDHPVLWLLKDADALDRVRLYDLEVGYLRHEETLRWVDRAKELYLATVFADDPRRIWEAAAQLGLPVRELGEYVTKQAANIRV
jgi:hypothetical protein